MSLSNGYVSALVGIARSLSSLDETSRTMYRTASVECVYARAHGVRFVIRLELLSTVEFSD